MADIISKEVVLEIYYSQAHKGHSRQPKGSSSLYSGISAFLNKPQPLNKGQ